MAKNLPHLCHSQKNLKSKTKKVADLLHLSRVCLNSSLAQLTGKLWSCKVAQI